MKRIVLIIIIIAYCFISFSMLFENGTDLSIDYEQLRTQNEYEGSIDKIPENISEKMLLTIKNKYASLKMDIEGEYQRQPITDQALELVSHVVKSNPDFMWNRTQSEQTPGSKTDVIIIFTSDNSCVICFPLENKIKTYDVIYNDRTIKFIDETFRIASFKCEFLHTHNNADYSQNKLEELVQSVESSDSDRNQNTVIYSESDTGVLNTGNDSFIKEYITPEIISIVSSGLLAFFSFLIIFNKTSRLIKYKYTRNLRYTLFPSQEHSWFSNNLPKDIYVSIKVHQKDGVKEYKLQNYFTKKLSGSPSVYAILGNAGEGKTFSLYKLALDILDGVYDTARPNNKKFLKRTLNSSQRKASNNRLIPIIINFSDVYKCSSEEDIIEFIYKKISEISGVKRGWLFSEKKEKTAKVLKRFLSTGKFVLMFDGYDEIVNIDDRLEFSKLLLEFINTYSECNYIITSRTQVYESERFENIRIENTVYLSPLSKEQIREFLSKWSFPKDKSDTQFFHRLINTVQLENVVSNPLLLTMVTHTYCKSDFVFSQSKTHLYEQCCKCLLENWEEQKSRLKRFKRFTLLPNVQIKVELLSQLAYEIYSGNGNNISESTALKLWSSHETEKTYYHGRTQEVLDNIINQSGLLEKTDTNLLRFRHRSFYEYFVALYFVKNTCTPPSSFQYTKGKENIIFFYLSLVENDEIVLDFLSKYLYDTKTVLDVLVERTLSDEKNVVNILKNILPSIDYDEIINLQAIGYIAQQYRAVRSLVLQELIAKLDYCKSKQTSVNIIVGLMSLGPDEQIKSALNSNINRIKIDDLVRFSGEEIKDYSNLIIDIINRLDEKRDFIECLAKEYRFDAIYNIYLYNASKYNKDLAIMGLLYMAEDNELLSFLKLKRFVNTLDYKVKKSVNVLQGKYGWIEKLDYSEIEVLYTLIYLVKELIKDGFNPNISLIDNRVKFLISYILSDESGEIHSDLINIPDFKMISSVEFSYHWNRCKQNKFNDLFVYNGAINAPILNKVIIAIVFLLFISQTVIYLFYRIQIYNLVYKGWEVKNSAISEVSILPFNSMYLLFLASIFFICFIVYKLMKVIDYSYFTIALSLCASLVLFTTYTFVVQNIVLRLAMIIALSCICICENIKHRYNYPSFKEPQYSQIVAYLQ